jgi:hypothetical protein
MDGTRTRVYSVKIRFGESKFVVKFDLMENMRQWEKLGCNVRSQPSRRFRDLGAHRSVWISKLPA